MFSWISMENMDAAVQAYAKMGFFMGMLLTFLESYLPFLPLFAIVVANASAYGLVPGFIFSWLGTVLGAYSVFLIIRRFGHHPRLRFVTEQKSIKRLISWVDVKGFTPLLILLCFPFTPVTVVNIVAGLSNIKRKYYFLTLLIGKPVMIFLMSYLGNDLEHILESPRKIFVVVAVIIIVWIAGKLFERHLNKKVAAELRSRYK